MSACQTRCVYPTRTYSWAVGLSLGWPGLGSGWAWVWLGLGLGLHTAKVFVIKIKELGKPTLRNCLFDAVLPPRL